MIDGKIPPQAIDLEEAILGAILLEKNAINEICDILTPQMFYKDTHSMIYECMLYLNSTSNPIDLLTVSEQLRKNSELEKCGGVYYLSLLTDKIASSANIEYHSRIVIQKYMQREIIRISSESIKDAHEDTIDVFDLLDSITTSFMAIDELKGTNIKNLKQIKEKIKKGLLLGEPLAKIIKLGICNLDFLTKTFNIIAGYQGTGKTAFVLSSSINIAKSGQRVGILSAEMSDMMLGARAMQSDTSISSKRIVTNNISGEEKEKIFEVISNDYDELIFVDDSTELTHRNIISKIKSFVQKFKIDIIFVDYMQLVDVSEKNTLDVKGNEKLSNKLQMLAKKLDICIVGLSQLARTEKNEKPTSNSLRGGGLEQAASDIFILYDEYWKENNGKEWKEISHDIRGKIEVIYAKGRYSEVMSNWIFFDKPKQKMTDWNMNESENKTDYNQIF